MTIDASQYGLIEALSAFRGLEFCEAEHPDLYLPCFREPDHEGTHSTVLGGGLRHWRSHQPEPEVPEPVPGMRFRDQWGDEHVVLGFDEFDGAPGDWDTNESVYTFDFGERRADWWCLIADWAVEVRDGDITILETPES